MSNVQEALKVAIEALISCTDISDYEQCFNTKLVDESLLKCKAALAELSKREPL